MSRVTKVENDEAVTTIPFSKGSFWRALVVSQLSVHSPGEVPLGPPVSRTE